MGRTQAPLWHKDDFVSGHVQTAVQYWKETILTGHPQRDELLGYIGGVRLSEFIDPISAGIFEGFPFDEADVTPIELPNHVPTSHDGWVKNGIESLVQKDSLAAWSTVADTKTQPRPCICLPLGVEPSKPRLIWDARYLKNDPSLQLTTVCSGTEKSGISVKLRERHTVKLKGTYSGSICRHVGLSMLNC